MYNDTITIFNHFKTNSVDVWYATTLAGVDLNTDESLIRQKYGEGNNDRAILHIKYAYANGAITIGGKTYLPPKAWKAQSADTLDNSITFKSGKDGDFFIRGAWSGSAVISDGDYTHGFFDHMNKSSDDCYVITSAAWYSVIPHFEIAGR